jgi:iron complex outermembrane recepter protein
MVMKVNKRIKIFIISSILFIFNCSSNIQKIDNDLAPLSIEDLMKLKVTTPEKRVTKWAESATPIFVITAEDIHRSGYTNFADILKLVPGMQVARMDANKWAVSCRGFNDIFASKLLVLIDGRSVYTPLFSGVFWETIDLVFDDVDRIEVIRGPGATLWGSNAVDGVINIITKKASQTQQSLCQVGFGSEERAVTSIRYGGQLSHNHYYRCYAKYFKRDNFVQDNGKKANDEWSAIRGGFRADVNLTNKDWLTYQGDFSNNRIGQLARIIASPTNPQFQTFDTTAIVNSSYFLTRYTHTTSTTSDLICQFYYDYNKREAINMSGTFHTFDFDLQHRFGLGMNQEILWGIGYRFLKDDIQGTFNMSMNPTKSNLPVATVFFQDNLALFDDRIRMTFGSKFEHNDFTGWEIQPNIRLLGIVNKYQSMWCALSRAVRTPSRVENNIMGLREVRNILGAPFYIMMVGNHDFKAEELLAHEVGYRWKFANYFIMDLAIFYNKYSKLRSYQLEIEPFKFYNGFGVPIYFVNKMSGYSYGGELTLDFELFPWWRIQTYYSYLKIDLQLKQKNYNYYDVNKLAKSTEGESPTHQFSIRHIISMSQRFEFNCLICYVDGLSTQKVDSYWNLDSRFACNLAKKYQIAVVGQNLFAPRHWEYRPLYSDIVPSAVERGVYGEFIFKF